MKSNIALKATLLAVFTFAAAVHEPAYATDDRQAVKDCA